ncbi:RNA exonuclease 5 [Paroedura picta]|uniref:RNA exonuclease 5 n=1 Tax=Paroedura picta TaxID=143630 RepID=UPI0040573245
MAAATRATQRKRPREDDNTVEGSWEPKKKRKLAEEDAGQRWNKVTGKRPRLSSEAFGEDCEIDYRQLHRFLKWAAAGKGQSAARPRWCRIHHPRRLTGTVVVVLHGLSQLHFYRFYAQFKHLRKTFRHRFSLPPISGFADTEISDFPPLSKEELKKDPVVQKYGEEKRGLSSYILTPEEMRQHNFPLEESSDCRNFVSSCCDVRPSDGSPLFGLDCEMCLTDKGSELTRISVVDASGQCVMDELVKPSTPIRNYLTRYSGITEDLLLSVTTKLPDVQARLQALLPPDAVLVGHSLNFDLHALQMIHPNVIDTSLLFARKGGKRFRLKFLAAAVLRKEIQRTDQEGHDPTEDATCALELAQFFMNQGPRKVAELNLESRWLEQSRAGGSPKAEPKNGAQKQARTPVRCLLDVLRSLSGKRLLPGGRSEDAPDNGPPKPQGSEEIPGSPFRVLQLPSDPRTLTPHLTADLRAKLRSTLSGMRTVFAGPFRKGFCQRALRRTFEAYGHIRSMRVVTETRKPHICIQYEVLEAAQLAIENLNGAEVAGSCIKVQRPLTELTLDCETLLRQLEADVENEGVLYVAGLEEASWEAEGQAQWGFLEDLKSVFQPRDPRSGKRRNYCFLRFPTGESASTALKTLQGRQRAKGGKLHGRGALTPPHLHRWLCHEAQNADCPAHPQLLPEASHRPEKVPVALEQDVKSIMKACDNRIKKLYRGLPSRTLCIVLLLGTDSTSVSLPGFCLLAIKDDDDDPASH